MVEELRRIVIQKAAAVDGLLGVVISDKEGIPILKAAVDQNAVVLDSCFRHQFLSISNTISEHAGKMCLGNTNHILSSFDHYQVIHCNHSPLIVTLVAMESSMHGELLNFSNLLRPLVSDISKAVIAEA